MAENYKFPDELENEKLLKAEEELEVHTPPDEDDYEIEIVDSTPEKDRGRRPLDREVADPTEEEINQYTKGAQDRIKELTHARHDERRAKEALLREKQEYERLAQQLIDENKRLKNYVETGTKQYGDMAKTSAEQKLEMARRNYKAAQEAFDTDAIIAAQEALTEAKMELEAAKNFRAPSLQVEKSEVYSQPQQVQQQPDEKFLRWQAKNQWYGQDGFEEITSFALGLHKKLVNSGVDPRSDQYYEAIDSRLRKTFPEEFGGKPAEKAASTSNKSSSVVAPGTRTTGKRVYKLTPEQNALVKKFKLDPKLYAAEVLKLERQNG